MSDFIHDLGLPFLAHRLRRTGETMADDCGQWLPEIGVKAPSRAGSTMLLLRRDGALGITEIADRVKLTHPLIIGLIAELEKLGLVKISRDAKDARRRIASLTKAGLADAERIHAATDRISTAYRDLFAEIGVDLLAALERVEVACKRKPISERLRTVQPEQSQPRPRRKPAA